MTNLMVIHGLLGPLEGLMSPPPPGLALQDRYARLPGHGSLRAMPPPEGLSLDGQAHAVIDQLRASAAGGAWLLGHSVGGAIALRAAALAPELVLGVVSVEGNFTLEDAFWSRRIAAMDFEAWREVHAAMVADPAAWMAATGLPQTRANRAAATAILQFQSAATLHQLARSVVADTGAPRYLADLRRCLDQGLSLHLLAGERSAAGWDVPPWVRKSAASSTVVPRTGHMLPLEDGEALWRAVAAAVAGVRNRR
jgi:pimeloyl-ACP methyl ester carboxylesterase